MYRNNLYCAIAQGCKGDVGVYQDVKAELQPIIGDIDSLSCESLGTNYYLNNIILIIAKSNLVTRFNFSLYRGKI